MNSPVGGCAVRPRRFRGVFALVSGLVLALSPLVSGPDATVALLVPYLPASAHNAHGFWLAHGDLARSASGQAWVRGAEAALLEPAPVSPPFQTAGSFESTDPAALGYRFSAQSGRRVEIAVELPDARTGAEIFVDVYRLGSGGAVHVASGPPQPASGTAQTRHSIELDLLDDAEYVLRLQPELGRGGRYKLGIRTAPMLGFPVAGFDTRAIQSGFGAVRDGGRRSHHGVDIFVPRGTPAVAAVDARVSRVPYDASRRQRGLASAAVRQSCGCTMRIWTPRRWNRASTSSPARRWGPWATRAMPARPRLICTSGSTCAAAAAPGTRIPSFGSLVAGRRRAARSTPHTRTRAPVVRAEGLL